VQDEHLSGGAEKPRGLPAPKDFLAGLKIPAGCGSPTIRADRDETIRDTHQGSCSESQSRSRVKHIHFSWDCYFRLDLDATPVFRRVEEIQMASDIDAFHAMMHAATECSRPE
jgi:hypothetical protein